MAAAAFPSIDNLVHELSTSTGTGNFSTSAVNGKQTFNGAFSNGATTDVFYYFISNRDVASEREWGTGHMSAASTLVRDTILGGSNGTSATNFSAGTKDVVCDIPATRQRIIQGMGTPGGRLTLASATPIMTSTQSAKTTIYYALYNGNQIPIYNGVEWQWLPFTELSNITSNSSTGNAGPATVTTNSNYDLFVWNSSGTLYLTRGPLWTSDTGRGTGAGTTELQMIQGIWTNKVAITNGPGANLGTYVGSVRSNGSSQIDWNIGSSNNGGSQAAILGVWNMYNRVFPVVAVSDSSSTYTYTSATIRALRADNGNRISTLIGLVEEHFFAIFSTRVDSAVLGGYIQFGIGVNSTTAFAAAPNAPQGLGRGTLSTSAMTYNFYAGAALLGFNYFQSLEQGDGTNANTVYVGVQNTFTALIRM